MKLKEYNRKRNFNKSSEPKGKLKNTKDKLRYCVQHHIATRDHYDFRLEYDGAMLSWAIPKGPTYDVNEKRLAIKVEDHPLDYRTFEGTIPKGEYGGGTVMLWDTGYYVPEDDMETQIEKGAIKFTIQGERLKGKWALIKIKPRENSKQDTWLLIKENDKFVNKDYDINKFNTSIKTGKTMDEITNSKNELKKDLEVKKAKSKTNSKIKNVDLSNVDAEIKITSKDKVMFTKPKVTKGALVDYYSKVAKRMLPFVQGRLLNLVRCPNGTGKQCFYKKHPNSDLKGVGTIDIKNSEGVAKTYKYIENAYGLISEVQMNTIEFHTWASKIDTINVPDIMVFDLDPDENMKVEKIKEGAKDLKSLLDELNLKSYLKTSGNKGYHIVVPIKQAFNWEEFNLFAKRVAKFMETKWSDKYTSNIRKEKRKGKIFIDWQRNGKGATSVAPYSVRAKEGCKVSMPISWKDLDKIAPDDIDIFEALKMIDKKDPWADFFD